MVIPQKFQARVLEEHHSSHPDIQRKKSLASGHLWWPGLDREIRNMVKACIACQQVNQAPVLQIVK